MTNIIPIMEQLDPKDILIFTRVADLGSFSKAALYLDLPKATVSRRLRFLEEMLGERLLQRTTRRLQLTEFGEHLLERAQPLTAEFDAVNAFVAHRQVEPSGRLYVSMPNDFAVQILPEMLHAFMCLHPNVTLELDLSPRRVDILGENFDLAIRTGHLLDDSALTARRIALLSIGLYAAPSYVLSHGAVEKPEALAKHAILSLSKEKNPVLWTLENGKQQRALRLEARLKANAPDLLIKMTALGAGIAALPDCFARMHLLNGSLQRVLPNWSLPAHPVWVVFPGRRLMPAKTRAFLDMLETAMSDNPKSRSERV